MEEGGKAEKWRKQGGGTSDEGGRRREEGSTRRSSYDSRNSKIRYAPIVKLAEP